MGWTLPRTWTDAELVTAAMMNPHVRDNLNALRWASGRKTSDQSVNNSTALVDVTGMLIAVAASEIWAFLAFVKVTGGTTSDIKFAFTVPAAATIDWNHAGGQGTGETYKQPLTTSTSGTSDSFAAGASAFGYTLLGIVVNSTTAGNLQLQFAQSTAVAENTTVKQNSWIVGLRLA